MTYNGRYAIKLNQTKPNQAEPNQIINCVVQMNLGGWQWKPLQTNVQSFLLF